MNERLNNAIPYKIDVVTSGDNTLIAAVSDSKHDVFRLWLIADGAVDVTFKSGSTALTGPMSLVAQTIIEWPFELPGFPYLTTAEDEALVMTLSGAVQVSGVMLASTN